MANQATDGIKSGAFKKTDLTDTSDFGNILQSNNIADRSQMKWYTKFNRFGVLDPYNAVTTTKEYLFFTKPDLHICTPGTTNLNPQLANYPFWQDLHKRYPQVINQLQSSIYAPNNSNRNMFMNILSNSVKNTLDLPSITSGVVDTAANIYGTTIKYRGDGYTDDENFSFNLEFEDTKYLEIYYLLKAYEEYERLKSQGIVSPPNVEGASGSNARAIYTRYHQYKELHDQFGIYKFVVGDDYQTLLYWAYICGAYFKSVPRDSFSDTKVDGGLRYSVEFDGWLVYDADPSILINFNRLIVENMVVPETVLPIYNTDLNMVDGRWASIPKISMRSQANVNPSVWKNPTGMQHDYVLKWRV